MRLNFAGVPDEDIRDGIGRIGRAVREQLGLLGSLTGSVLPGAESAPPRAPEREADSETPLADVVALPRRDQSPPARRRRDR
jgi:hypothetical protein